MKLKKDLTNQDDFSVIDFMADSLQAYLSKKVQNVKRNFNYRVVPYILVII